MFNKTKRIFAIVLAVALVFALAGCKGVEDDGSSVEYVIEEEVVVQGGNNSQGQTVIVGGDENNANTNDGNTNDGNTNDGNANAGNNNAGNNNTGNNNAGNNNAGNNNAGNNNAGNNNAGNNNAGNNNAGNNNAGNNNAGNNNAGNNNTGNNNAGNNNAGNNNAGNNDAGNNNAGNNNAGNNNAGNNDAGNNDAGNNDAGTTNTNGIDYEALKGTTVKFASTIDPKDDGTQYVVDSFEEKYGMKVEIVKCTLPGYVQEMQGLIANGTSPDVGRSNGDFPACIAYFDSLDKSKMDYSDPIWNQNTFRLTTFNGSPYMCDTYGCYWTELDICMYSKRLLKAAGCPTPEELDAQGQWTWDNFMMIAEKCTQKMGSPAGCINTNELALHMAGGNIFKIENEKIVNGIDGNTTAIVKKFAEAWKKGILNGQSTVGIAEGTTAIGTGHAWSLRKDGDVMARGANVADLGFYYLPAYTAGGARPATGIFRGFGIMRGAANPVGGGVFLRHYLDVNNYDTENAFINENAKNFFFQLTTQDYEENYNPYLTYIGLNQDIAGVNYGTDIYAVMKMDPSAVDGKMAAVKAAVDKGAKNLNDHITKYLYSN